MFRLLRLYRRIRSRRRVGVSLVLTLVFVSVFGNATCFYWFEGRAADRGFSDALWYSVISITTIGYGDISAATLGGRIGTFFFVVILGIGTFTVFLSMMVDWGTDLALKGQFGMGSVITSDHVLIVNFPSPARVRHLIEELKSDPMHGDRDIVIVSDQIERLPFTIENVLFVHGAPLERQTYVRAKADRARMAIVLAASHDAAHSDALAASSVSVINSMSDQIHVVAECIGEKHRMLFESVQCKAVVSGSKICDNLLVQEVNDPGIAQMVDVITSNIRGATLYSTRVTEPRASVSYNQIAKALLDKDVNILCVNRENESYTSFRTVTPQAGDRVIYVAAGRIDWPTLLVHAGVG